MTGVIAVTALLPSLCAETMGTNMEGVDEEEFFENPEKEMRFH